MCVHNVELARRGDDQAVWPTDGSEKKRAQRTYIKATICVLAGCVIIKICKLEASIKGNPAPSTARWHSAGWPPP